MNAREAALVAVNAVMIDKAYANIAVAKMLRSATIPDKDRKLFVELTYGSIKALGTLDWFISHYVDSIKKIDPIVLNVLRIGYYQLFFLDKIPVSAACNEAVNLTKKYSNGGAAKFVNAVMRAAVRQPEKIKYPDQETQPARYIALKFFHPLWLVERWIKQFGFEQTEKLCEFDNTKPELSVRVNSLTANIADIEQKLKAQNYQVQFSKWSPDGLLLSGIERLDELNELQSGSVVIQDESSQLVAYVLNPQPGEFVIDCCAAPGGKTTHIAALMKNRGRVVACDIFQHKIDMITQNVGLAGASIVEPVLCDARTIGEKYYRQADRVLVDAPCSGLGILRKKADLRWKKQPDQFGELYDLQRDILNSAAQAVRIGGEMVYSTCTTDTTENEAVVERFLCEHNDFELVNAGKRMPCEEKSEIMINMRPFSDQTDGFFIALLRRKS
ncbi:MAG: 16S rRNA (cytosine(967)-C(5))-methyltransferase RsmB [Negativicutes bacterium]|jgi:16S rRNA (cytosine967-C5)-methyltransferase